MPAPWRDELIYVQRVGGLSLAALFLGGTILIFFGVNVFLARRGLAANMPIAYDNSQAIFNIGSEIGVQEWLAVLGAGFSLLSFGLIGTYHQIFDFWCSNRATKTRGLDYARYLNSQPRAPVLFGFRGFPGFVVGRYVVVALSIAASISYKFAVVEVTIQVYEHMEPSKISLRLPPMQGLVENGTASPWLGDGPAGRKRAFLQQQDADDDKHLLASLGRRSLPTPNNTSQPPSTLIMVGWADCDNALHTFESGLIFTREIVVVANQTQEEGEFFMTADPFDWTRVKGLGRHWLGTAGAVIDYRIPSVGILQVQWAENGSWLDDGSRKQLVEHRITYNMSLAIAEVRRLVSSGDCSWIDDKSGQGELPSTQIFGQSTAPMMAEQVSIVSLPNSNWVDAILVDQDTGPQEGISLLVRSAMAVLGAQLAAMNGTHPGHAPIYSDPSHQTQWPFGPSYNDSKSRTENNVVVEYPIFSGTRSTSRTGSYYRSATAFVLIGVVAYLVVFVRIMVGPSELTSWMGQHVYLTSTGKIQIKDVEQLANGYHVARDLGVLRTNPNPPVQKPAPTFAQIWTGPPARHHYIPSWVRGITGSLAPYL